jgi:hypothetical protein
MEKNQAVKDAEQWVRNQEVDYLRQLRSEHENGTLPTLTFNIKSKIEQRRLRGKRPNDREE